MVLQTVPQESLKKILILASDSKIVKTLQDWLKGLSVEADAAEKSLDAVSLARLTDYRLILIDKDLDDGMGSMEALWLLRPLARDANIAVIAEQVDPEEESTYKSHGVQEWIHKPFSRQRTLSEIEAILNNPKMDLNPPSFSFFRRFKNLIFR